MNLTQTLSHPLSSTSAPLRFLPRSTHPNMPSIINSQVQTESDLLPTVEYQKVANKHITKAVGRLRDHVFVSGQGLQVVTSVS